MLPPCCLCFILLTLLLSRLPHTVWDAISSSRLSPPVYWAITHYVIVLTKFWWWILLIMSGSFFQLGLGAGTSLSNPTDDFPEAKRYSFNGSRNAEQAKQQISSRGKHFKVFSNEWVLHSLLVCGHECRSDLAEWSGSGFLMRFSCRWGRAAAFLRFD